MTYDIYTPSDYLGLWCMLGPVDLQLPELTYQELKLGGVI